MIFQRSVTHLVIAIIVALLATLLLGSLIAAWHSLEANSRALAIKHFTQADRALDAAAVATRGQIPRDTTALIAEDDPRPTIEIARQDAQTAVGNAIRMLRLLRLRDADRLIADIEDAARQEAQEKRFLDLEASLPPARRSLERIKPWRDAANRTNAALNEASVVVGNTVSLDDPVIAALMQVHRYAWTIRKHYGIQCSDLRDNINAGLPLTQEQSFAWRANLAIYDEAWRDLNGFLHRPGVSAQLSSRVRLADSLTRTSQARISEAVAHLGSTGSSPMPAIGWTLTCDAPFDAILAIGGQAETEAVDHATALSHGALIQMAFAGLGVMVVLSFGLVAVLLIDQRLARPMGAVTQAISRLGRRDFSVTLPPSRYPDELAAIGRALETLRLNEIEAERLQLAMEQFTADASHEMRTPLTILSSHIGVLLATTPPESPSWPWLKDIEQAAGRLQRLLLQLISLARAESDAQSHEDVDLVSLVRNTTASYISQASAAKLELHFDCEVEKLSLVTSPFFLVQMLGNLVDNAIRYSKTGSAVIVRLIPSTDGARIEVEDDGPGIPETERLKVFQRFYRLHRDHPKPGSGLGLSIVQSLAEKLDAKVTLGTGHEGRGLCASIVLVSDDSLKLFGHQG